MQALCAIIAVSPRRYSWHRITKGDSHKMPAAKIMDVPNFLEFLICKRHTLTIGRTSIRKSDATLIEEVTMIGILILIQCPLSVLSQIFARGEHSKIFTIVSAK